MTKEEYIDISEYGYDADKGIWSKAKEKFLKGNVYPSGYVRVTLNCVDGEKRTFLYHRVIWYLAYGTIPEGLQVNHIDENKQNNALSNLNLMTHKENNNWGTHNKRVAAKLSKAVEALDNSGNVVYEFPSTREADRHGFDQSAVSACCRKQYYGEGNNIYKNLRWYFKEDLEKLIWERKLEVKKV